MQSRQLLWTKAQPDQCKMGMGDWISTLDGLAEMLLTMLKVRTRSVLEVPCDAGVDEAGRGPLAGPVVAAACHVPLDVDIECVRDSKKLTAARRELVFQELTTHPRIRWAM